MENIEYTKMAYLYDKFYANKDYSNEVDFLKQFINNNSLKILDAGCGSGSHAKILYELGYNIHGFDLSSEMVNIANKKISNHFFVDNLLNIKCRDKYDVIYSFFAVFNHFKNYKEFKTALINLKSILNDNGKIIIDLHNPQKSGRKIECVENAERTMEWRKCNILKKEYTNITYVVDGKVYKAKHVFKIFNIDRLRKIATQLGFTDIQFYENYNVSKKASKHSKNIQMIIS